MPVFTHPALCCAIDSDCVCEPISGSLLGQAQSQGGDTWSAELVGVAQARENWRVSFTLRANGESEEKEEKRQLGGSNELMSAKRDGRENFGTWQRYFICANMKVKLFRAAKVGLFRFDLALGEMRLQMCCQFHSPLGAPHSCV